MNSNKRKLTEQEIEEFREKLNRPLRTVFTEADIAAIVAAIESNNGQSPAQQSSGF